MPLVFEISPDLMTVETVGDVDFEEGAQMLVQALNDYHERCSGQPRISFDIRKSTEKRSSEELAELARLVFEHLPSARILVLAPETLDLKMASLSFCYHCRRLGGDGLVVNGFESGMTWLRQAA